MKTNVQPSMVNFLNNQQFNDFLIGLVNEKNNKLLTEFLNSGHPGLLNNIDEDGNNYLHQAIEKKWPQFAVDILKQHKALREGKNNAGKTPSQLLLPREATISQYVAAGEPLSPSSTPTALYPGTKSKGRS